MRATDGYGVDVILNSLTGDLLDESWRCIANGGTMVELGKKVSSSPVANGHTKCRLTMPLGHA